jgi:transcriptional regulator with PAS, ATPase and Fis domain
MQTVYEMILQSSSNDANVIIYGESGTGKELVAHSIHDLSGRKNKSFVAVNCGAINENLIESEFFGYKKGAFTGAASDTPGYFDKSNKGSLFLDELGEMSMNMQVKLLRAIEGQGYAPVGGNTVKTSDFRIIAATNQNLTELIKNKKMREDFYYRIHILPIYLPLLRERKEDIPLLIDHFLDIYPGKGSEKVNIPIHIKEAFQTYDWPGNVRELQNAVYRYITLGEIVFINEKFQTENDSYENFYDDVAGTENGLDVTMAQIEKKILLKALEKYQWNRGKTAEHLNIDRKTLYRKIKSLDVITHK